MIHLKICLLVPPHSIISAQQDQIISLWLSNDEHEKGCHHLQGSAENTRWVFQPVTKYSTTTNTNHSFRRSYFLTGSCQAADFHFFGFFIKLGKLFNHSCSAIGWSQAPRRQRDKLFWFYLFLCSLICRRYHWQLHNGWWVTVLTAYWKQKMRMLAIRSRLDIDSGKSIPSHVLIGKVIGNM